MPSSEGNGSILPALIQGTALVGSAYVLGRGLAKLGNAAEACVPAVSKLGNAAEACVPAVAEAGRGLGALGRSADRLTSQGLLRSLFPWYVTAPPPLAAAACRLGCVLAQRAVPASSGEAMPVSLLHQSMFMTLSPPPCLPAARRRVSCAASATRPRAPRRAAEQASAVSAAAAAAAV